MKKGGKYTSLSPPKQTSSEGSLILGERGNNWIEPLREWILAAHYAEKLASYSAEGGKEKIGYKFHL